MDWTCRNWSTLCVWWVWRWFMSGRWRTVCDAGPKHVYRGLPNHVRVLRAYSHQANVEPKAKKDQRINDKHKSEKGFTFACALSVGVCMGLNTHIWGAQRPGSHFQLQTRKWLFEFFILHNCVYSGIRRWSHRTIIDAGATPAGLLDFVSLFAFENLAETKYENRNCFSGSY